MLTRLGGALGCALLLLATTAPAAEPDLANNAALKYWRGFEWLPRGDEFKALLEKNPAEVDPADPEIERLLKDRPALLDMLHRGAKIAACDWGVDHDAGPHMLLPHLAKCRLMARVACLRARRRLATGDAAGASDDYAAAVRLARHASTDGTLIAVLVRFAIELMVQDAVAADLLKMDAAARRALLPRLTEGLPKAYGIRESVLVERKYFLDWMEREVKAGRTAYPEFEDLGKILRQIGDRNAALKQLADMRPYYDDLAAMADLAPAAAAAKYKGLMERAKGNAFASALLPAYDRVLLANDRLKARTAMLKAAFAIADGGDPQAQRDPFGDGPFAYRKTDGGFTLTSKFVYKVRTTENGREQTRDEPVTLTVGPRSK